MVGRDLPNLQVGARRHVGIASAKGIGGIGQAAHLPGVQDAVGNAQPAHEGVLGRRGVEKPMILGQENIDALGEFALLGALDDLVPAIERMALALGLFFRRQLAAGRDGAVLGSVLQRIRPDRLRRGGCCRGRRRRGLPRGKAAGESLQPAFLLVGEFGHVTALGSARRNAMAGVEG